MGWVWGRLGLGLCRGGVRRWWCGIEWYALKFEGVRWCAFLVVPLPMSASRVILPWLVTADRINATLSDADDDGSQKAAPKAAYVRDGRGGGGEVHVVPGRACG